MSNIENFFKINNVFETKSLAHETNFFKMIKSLTIHHKKNCYKYNKFFRLVFSLNQIKKIEDVPFLPVQVFKSNDLKSFKDEHTFKKISSSGTSGINKSKIYLDKNNAENQVKALGKILSSKFGKTRHPMLIIDRDLSKTSRKEFSASIAAVHGFSLIANKKYYLLDDNFKINYKVLDEFLMKHSSERFFIFGFTSFVYNHLIKDLDSSKYKFKNAVLIHGGGWKKLEKQKISNTIFKNKLKDNLHIEDVVNYYGLVEQTGSIFFECKYGYFVNTIFSDVIIRDKNFKVLPSGKRGLIQLISILPSSYPGHNIITEDLGSVMSTDFKCKCGLNGKHFLVYGRAKEAEVRGCSDTK